MEASNPPEDISTYVLKENEVQIIKPKYNVETGEISGGGLLQLWIRQRQVQEYCIHIIEKRHQTLPAVPYLIATGR